jgi:hypothetical protein
MRYHAEREATDTGYEVIALTGAVLPLLAEARRALAVLAAAPVPKRAPTAVNDSTEGVTE